MEPMLKLRLLIWMMNLNDYLDYWFELNHFSDLLATLNRSNQCKTVIEFIRWIDEGSRGWEGLIFLFKIIIHQMPFNRFKSRKNKRGKKIRKRRAVGDSRIEFPKSFLIKYLIFLKFQIQWKSILLSIWREKNTKSAILFSNSNWKVNISFGSFTQRR